jgi:hypothetical protein
MAGVLMKKGNWREKYKEYTEKMANFKPRTEAWNPTLSHDP